MSKSIYEEVIERMDVEFDAWDRAERFELFELIEQALEQAQNQEKLLELHKRLINLYEKLYDTELSHYYEIEIIKLKYQIKELENEGGNDHE